ncbi:N-acetyltransferase [Aquihabitans sp. G128]|uniref:GNAT family N-acetyltransferase n=1 Tax=Aquihabitans sp. G128 TaxID=2849779 RepID=UPI001C23425B|nr:GNAT family N-acetyltransferase [Aquihabitans sp. G128]QXC62598.1 N-acetyltransferase [Aquihabitans sp. G128]
MTTEIRVHADDHGEGRYTILVDGQPAGELDYRTIDGRRAFTHTGIRDRYEGQGLAGQLARRVLDDARAEGLQIIPLCPYVAGYLEKHPGDQDLVDQEAWARLKG